LKLQALECLKRNAFNESINLLEEATMVDKNDPSVCLNIAIVQASISSGKIQEAIDMLAKVITLDSDTVVSRTAHSLRSTLYGSLGEVDKVREDVMMAARMGDKVARDKLRMNNPYAAMCDEVLKGAMTKYCKERV
jgi:lipopolysaccharide biosynthesis regulator YciM